MEKDLELLEKAFLVIGLAESDEQLEKLVTRFLCPIILKISSDHKSVQDKVMEVLTHISKRITSRPNVKLPIDSLLEILQSPSSSAVAKNFSLIYYKVGFTRLSSSDQVDLLPVLITLLEGKTSQQMDSILQLYITALPRLSFPVEETKLESLLPPKDKPSLRSYFLQFMLCIIIMPYSHKGKLPPFGLSRSQVKQVTEDKECNPDGLEKLKLSVLKLLCSGSCNNEEIVCHLVVGMSDTRHSINDYSENQWKQTTSIADYEHVKAVDRLFNLYLGNAEAKGDPQSPGSLRLKVSATKFFNKSVYAANSFPLCIKTVFDGLFGTLTNGILRVLTMEFILHIIFRATPAKLQIMSPLLMTALNKIIDLPESKEERKLLLHAHTGMGLLAKSSPQLFRKDPKHILKLMDALRSTNEREVKLSVQECLSAVAKSYAGVTGDNAMILEAMILDNINHIEPHARCAAAYCSRIIFPFSHIPSRYVSLLASGDKQDEVRDEGMKGVKPNQDNPNASKEYPKFPSMVEYIYTRAQAIMKGHGSSPCYSVASGSLPYTPPTMIIQLKFLYTCLLLSADCSMSSDSINNPLERNQIIKLKEYLAVTCGDSDIINQYLGVIKYALSPAGDAELHGIALSSLLHILLASPLHVSQKFLPELDRIKSFTHSSNHQTRESAARVVRHLVSLLPLEELITFTKTVIRNTTSAVYTVQHGSIVTLGHIGALCNIQLPRSATAELNELVLQALNRLFEFLTDPTLHVVRYACSSLGELVRSGPIPAQDNSSSSSSINVKNVIEKLKEIIRETKDMITKERCVAVLGLLCIGDNKLPFKEDIIKILFSLKEDKHVDLQFTVGEALSCVIAGKHCQSATDPWDYDVDVKEDMVIVDMEVDGANATVQQCDELFDSTLTKLLDEFAFSSAPIVRQSACVWMLSVLKNISSHPSAQSYLQRFQKGFVNLLADTNDMIQEVASQGLVLIYELSESSQKESLVEILVGTLMEGRKAKQSISGDSKVFEEKSLGKTPTGSNLTTYKELCSLASDLNQPDLIYKFMHLANHNALWNSKKGAAFGMKTIAIHAKDQLAPYLPTLVPRLFRYKYDPIPRIQLAMSSIWDAIVTDTKGTIECYYKEIIKDLISNLSSNQWRNREASCLALRDLIVVYSSSEISNYLEELWEISLRARDDIKETVRKSADMLCSSLTKVTIKLCDSKNGRSGGEAVQRVLPVLLKTGMTSPAQEVIVISLLCIVKIAEEAGPLLKPHIPRLVPFLLESMSSLEPQALNTISLQFGNIEGIQEKLDSLRIAVSKSTPMMKTCNLCVPHIDPDVLTELVPQMVTILKSGVGLGTKVGCSQFLVSVLQEKKDDLTPHAGKILSALLSGLSDRNIAVRKNYAKAIGHYLKVAKKSSVNKVVERLKKQYYESGDSSVQSSVANVIHAIAQYSPDVVKDIAVDLAPLVFLAMHGTIDEEDKMSSDAIKIWKEVWQELVPNTSSGVKLYLNELMEQISPNVSAQSWEIKRTAANALSTIAEKTGSSLGPPHLATLLNTLMEGLQGRIWDGKDSLLKSLKSVCQSCAAAIKERQDGNQPDVDKILSCLYSQCGKNDLAYKTVAVSVTASIINSFSVDGFKEFHKIISPLIQTETASSDKMDVNRGEAEIEEERSKQTLRLDLHVTVFKAIGVSWPVSNEETQRTYFSEVCQQLCVSLPNNNWRIQEAILNSFALIITRIQFSFTEADLEMFSNTVFPNICQCTGNPRYFIIREGALKCIDKLTLALQSKNVLSQCCLNQSLFKLIQDSVSSLSTDNKLKELTSIILKRLGL